MDYAVWNTLHDGSIESVGGSVPGDVYVRVGIAYLCGKLPTAATHVVVHLRGCRQFEYRPFEGDAVADLSAIASADVEILSAVEGGGNISVACVGGFLQLSYDRVDITLAEGQTISQAELEAGADRYWAEWEANAQRAKR
ncbi:MAG TPA: hypothetical protein VG269_15225 [Tepidisphaeraceae bacterium]|nr:hypothetical protein [Tepidisphaeraceae bacterium]